MDVRNQTTNISNYCNNQYGGEHGWGDDDDHCGWGFFAGAVAGAAVADAFYAGVATANLWTPTYWTEVPAPLYVCSPVTGCVVGTVPPPPVEEGCYSQESAQVAVLQQMANPGQDPNDPNYDATAGLYPQSGFFHKHPDWDRKLSEGAEAYNELLNGNPIYFHPPNGDIEEINSLGDLNAYLYQQQTQ
ncbi:MAG: hypothetical protein ACYCW6_01635 [Candidatus Xenobia bacterium]